MRVLWFEISIPYRYLNFANPRNGWQDSLENLLRKRTGIELGIAFENNRQERKVIDDVVYYSLPSPHSTIWNFRPAKYWQTKAKRMLSLAIEVIRDFKPDIIHIFGSEWYWGLISKHTSIPVVIHMQGSIPPYFNSRLPPQYSDKDCFWHYKFNPRKLISIYSSIQRMKSRSDMEKQILAGVNYYMGRTAWDYNIVNLYNSKAKYYYCSEALREDFVQTSKYWEQKKQKKLILFTIGFDFRKGADSILKTAKLLKEKGVSFEWNVAGEIPIYVKKIIEKKEKIKYSDYNVNLLGVQSSTKIVDLLLDCDIYIHPAYLENSPNSICEAQYLGVPVIATFVGGVPSLIEHGKNGILVPTNEPHTLAATIIKLKNDKTLRLSLSENAKNTAKQRHNGTKIITDLINCYTKVIEDYGRIGDNR